TGRLRQPGLHPEPQRIARRGGGAAEAWHHRPDGRRGVQQSAVPQAAGCRGEGRRDRRQRPPRGPIIGMMENPRTGLPWNLLMSVPEVQAGLESGHHYYTLRVSAAALAEGAVWLQGSGDTAPAQRCREESQATTQGCNVHACWRTTGPSRNESIA